MATHSSILAWKIPWTEEAIVGYRPWGPRESDIKTQHFFILHTSCTHDIFSSFDTISLFLYPQQPTTLHPPCPIPLLWLPNFVLLSSAPVPPSSRNLLVTGTPLLAGLAAPPLLQLHLLYIYDLNVHPPLNIICSPLSPTRLEELPDSKTVL